MAFQRRPFLSFFLVLLACALLGGLYGAQLRSAGAAASDGDIQEALRTFTKVYSAVEQYYADPVSPDRAVYNGAIPGMLRTLDPHSNFFDPKMFQLLREEQRGKYYGVGMTVTPRNGKTMVLAPFVGSPAYRAGIRPGDIIAQVDDKPTDNLSTTEVAELLKGPKGTQVRILITREGSPKPLEFVITRDEIPRHSVEQFFEVRPGVGYVHIANFNETTSRELADALKKLNQGQLRGLILDLRGNPGGLLTEGVNVADMILHRNQVIVSHRGRASPEKVYRATHGNSGNDYPLVVLINRYSASAAEIVAGAVQDHDRGLVVGETSFGKGLVQTVYPLSENTGLALTTAKYYTPSGRLIQREYTGMSLYDYYYSNQEKSQEKNNGHPNGQTRTTDSGRIVYGGGGITPDVKVSAPKMSRFQQQIELKYAFFNFAKHYLARHSTVPRDFEVTDGVMNEFRAFLEQEKIPYTEQDLGENRDLVTRRIKQELFISVFGKDVGDRIQIESDPVVQKGIELLSQAKELAENARRLVAQKGGLR